MTKMIKLLTGGINRIRNLVGGNRKTGQIDLDAVSRRMGGTGPAFPCGGMTATPNLEQRGLHRRYGTSQPRKRKSRG